MTDRQPVTLKGAGPHLFTRDDNLKFNPGKTRANCQINADGLNAGTFSVYLLIPGVKGLKEHEIGKSEVDTVVIPNSISFNGVRVVLSTGDANSTVTFNTREP